MDTIPFIVLLIPYLFIVAVTALFLFFNVFHMWRYGIDGMGTTLLIIGYICSFAVIAGGTWLVLSGFTWGGTFSLSDFLPSGSGASSFGL